MLAKVCTDLNKPNGQYRLVPDRVAIAAFLKDLPVRKIPGVGRVMERLLNELGLKTAGQLVCSRRVREVPPRPRGQQSATLTPGRIARVHGPEDVQLDERVALHTIFLKASFDFLLQAAMGISATMTEG